jgi:phosphoglucomutase
MKTHASEDPTAGFESISAVIARARDGVSGYLEEAKASGQIDEQLYRSAMAHTIPHFEKWLTDPNIDRISPSLKSGLTRAVQQRKWRDIVNAFRQPMRFGTGGIRGMMAFDKESIVQLKEKGLDAPILKGPNTFNNIVLLLTSAGVARFGKDRNLEKIVIGYDSRIRGLDLAAIVAQLFLAYGYTVYFFDAPCPYPEVTYAIPDSAVRADLGILISASHNDYRYNGYKLSCGNGSQFDPEEREAMYDGYIRKARTDDIMLCSFEDAPNEKLYFLGGDAPVKGFDYAGKEANLINMHERHREHVKSFLMTADLAERQARAPNPLEIGFCAFHGSGNVAVPRLLEEVGFKRVWPVTKRGLNDCNGLFPSFRSAPGLEQQPDPGDPRAACVAVDAFKEEYPGKFQDIDVLIGTDPDADRCGVVVKAPEEQRFMYDDRDWTLLPADELWALIIWYRIHRDIERHGRIPDVEKKFITLSHTTSDCITKVALANGIGVLKTWVGFAALAAATREIWKGKHGRYAEYLKLSEGRHPDNPLTCDPFVQECLAMEGGNRSINIGAMEQSNGFSMLGGPPPDPRSLGENGHVRDKDGTFAAVLAAEVAAWAKEKGTTLFKLIDDNIYLDPAVGLFVNGYEPDPMDGEYPGIEGDRLKKAILRRALAYFQLALAGDLEIAGLPVTSACIYRTGKYDAVYPPSSDFQFPDEGIRFYFDAERLNHATIRPSGTGNSLRFHTQLHDTVSPGDLIEKKSRLRYLTSQIFAELRRMLKAPKGKLFLPKS